MREMNFKLVYADSMIEPTTLKRTRYASRKCAQNAADRLNAKLDRAKRGGSRYAVYSLEEYAKATKGKGEWRVSAADGKTRVWVALGTPRCCDPSSELYWTM
jgi:hypothetical protein